MASQSQRRSASQTPATGLARVALNLPVRASTAPPAVAYEEQARSAVNGVGSGEDQNHDAGGGGDHDDSGGHGSQSGGSNDGPAGDTIYVGGIQNNQSNEGQDAQLNGYSSAHGEQDIVQSTQANIQSAQSSTRTNIHGTQTSTQGGHGIVQSVQSSTHGGHDIVQSAQSSTHGGQGIVQSAQSSTHGLQVNIHSGHHVLLGSFTGPNSLAQFTQLQMSEALGEDSGASIYAQQTDASAQTHAPTSHFHLNGSATRSEMLQHRLSGLGRGSTFRGVSTHRGVNQVNASSHTVSTSTQTVNTSTQTVNASTQTINTSTQTVNASTQTVNTQSVNTSTQTAPTQVSRATQTSVRRVYAASQTAMNHVSATTQTTMTQASATTQTTMTQASGIFSAPQPMSSGQILSQLHASVAARTPVVGDSQQYTSPSNPVSPSPVLESLLMGAQDSMPVLGLGESDVGLSTAQQTEASNYSEAYRDFLVAHHAQAMQATQTHLADRSPAVMSGPSTPPAYEEYSNPLISARLVPISVIPTMADPEHENGATGPHDDYLAHLPHRPSRLGSSVMLQSEIGTGSPSPAQEPSVTQAPPSNTHASSSSTTAASQFQSSSEIPTGESAWMAFMYDEHPEDGLQDLMDDYYFSYSSYRRRPGDDDKRRRPGPGQFDGACDDDDDDDDDDDEQIEQVEDEDEEGDEDGQEYEEGEEYEDDEEDESEEEDEDGQEDEVEMEELSTFDGQVLRVPRERLRQTLFFGRLLDMPRPRGGWTIPTPHRSSLWLLMKTLMPDVSFKDEPTSEKSLTIILHAIHLGVKCHMPIEVNKLCIKMIRHLFGQFLYQTAVSRWPRRDLALKAFNLARAWQLITDLQAIRTTCIHPYELAILICQYVPPPYVTMALQDQSPNLTRDVEFILSHQPPTSRETKARIMLVEYRDGIEHGYVGPFARKICQMLEMPVPEWYRCEIMEPPTGTLIDIEGELLWELQVLTSHPANKVEHFDE